MPFGSTPLITLLLQELPLPILQRLRLSRPRSRELSNYSTSPFYHTESLCVIVMFILRGESILTLFEPVLNADNAQGQYRLPLLDISFVKAHGLLFTNRDMEVRSYDL
jgi:hypothetical protein